MSSFSVLRISRVPRPLALILATLATAACGGPTSATSPSGNQADASLPSNDASTPASPDAESGTPSGATDGAAPAQDAGGDAAAKGDPYNEAPPTRTVRPVAVLTVSGNVTNPTHVLSGQPTALAGTGAQIVLDFGKEVGGYPSFTFSASSDANQTLGVAFSESALYVGQNSDNSSGGSASDEALSVPVAGPSTYTVASPYLRGGFRYMTLFLTSSGSVTLDDISVAFSPDPDRAKPNQYPNYFYCNDDTLNHVWYAGAYTFQTNILRVNEGRVWPPAASSWNNGATVGELGDVILSDGAKRDRTVWPGDMGISLPTGYVSLFDTVSAKNSLATLYNHQSSTGELPYAGPPMNFGGSDTYHMWTLLGTRLYTLYSGDKTWLDSVWSKFKLGVAFTTAKIDSTGLLNVTETNDWARDGQGGDNLEANAILYGVLQAGVFLAQVEGDTASASTYGSQAASLKSQINATLWDSSVGAYKDNPTSTLHPQDGNSLAVWLGVTDSPSKNKSISYVLNENWNDKGSRGPEFTIGSGAPKISTYAGSMELMGHFVAGYDTRGLDMMRTMWGFMLSSPNGTASTFWEGFNSDGSFAYADGPTPSNSYTSLSHGWGTGPTSALTFYVLGVAPDSASGKTWHVTPHPGDLTHVEGDLTVATGEVARVSYDVGASCGSFQMSVDTRTVTGSTGTIGIPTFGASHTILIDGAVAWNGTSFTATTGITGASADDAYVYFTGVAPGLHVLGYADGKACPTPEQWSFCADENGSCTFTGTKRVRFGKNGAYDYAIVDGTTGAVACTTATFGTDPIPNTAKSCAVSSDLYVPCSNEGSNCVFTGTKQVRFGANGQWSTLTLVGGTACDVATFGDPVPNVAKRCETM